MKNLDQKPSAAFILPADEFETLCVKAYGDSVPALFYCLEGVVMTEEDELCKKLSAYLDVDVQSVHMDGSENIWIQYQEIPHPYDGIWVFVPEKQALIYAAEGTGDNLLSEDLENGCADYVEYQTWHLEDTCEEDDGGEWMLPKLLRDQYPSMEACIPDLLEFIYDISSLSYLILPKEPV